MNRSLEFFGPLADMNQVEKSRSSPVYQRQTRDYSGPQIQNVGDWKGAALLLVRHVGWTIKGKVNTINNSNIDQDVCSNGVCFRQGSHRLCSDHTRVQVPSPSGVLLILIRRAKTPDRGYREVGYVSLGCQTRRPWSLYKSLKTVVRKRLEKIKRRFDTKLAI
jgi:hypothetical protein